MLRGDICAQRLLIAMLTPILKGINLEKDVTAKVRSSVRAAAVTCKRWDSLASGMLANRQLLRNQLAA